MICSSCGTANPADQRFCGECGARLAAACPACGATNPPGQKFCGSCGTPIAAGGAPGVTGPRAVPAGHGTTAPVAERRLVSVLFADLVGFTPFAAERDAEEVRETLSRYFDLATEVVTRYGGAVEKFIGDAVMAIWGAPTAHEDDAERAVRAGLELIDAVRALGPGIQARAGVLTGEAAVTIGATNQGMVAGDLVNTASRLQSVAAPGTVLVGEATQRAASMAIAFEAIGEQTLKGKAAPVPAWRALRVVAEVGGRNRSDAFEAPFVGRDEELRLLKDLFHATDREKRARLVSVIGPAGIGKTRLAWEFLKYADGLVEDVWYHDGRSPAYGDGITFWALGEMVRERCQLLETDDAPTTRTKVAATLATHVPDPDERRWIEPSLLALLGVETSMGSEQLFGAWRTFFERLAASAPVIMVFEDFHYADSGLLDFVDHLLEWSRAFPIYVVTLARPELLDKRPEWGAGKRSFTSVFLEPLPDGAMRELLAGLVPGLPESAAKAIVARADGVPLYAVETVRMLLAEGRLTFEDGAYRPTGDLTGLAVPESLTALIASRLDGLPADERSLVSDAAVLGQSFVLPGLSVVSGLPEETLTPLLRSLVRRELFVLESDPRSPERGQYAFVQALIREVAYNTLAKRDRKSRHLAAARFFESLATDEIAGGLAGHYLAAYRNAPDGPEADAVAVQARIALRGAAERAAALGAHDQSRGFLDQALTVSADPAETAELLERAGEAASAAGRHEAAEGYLRGAITAQRELGDRPATVRATAALGRALLGASRSPEAVALLEPATAEFADLRADAAAIALGGQLARAYLLVEDNRRAIQCADTVLEAAEHADLKAIVADTLVTKGTALARVGRTIEGLGAITAGQALAEAAGLDATFLRAHTNRSALGVRSDPRAALEVAQAGLVVARRLGRRSQLSILLTNAAESALRTGDWLWALDELDGTLAEEFEPADRSSLLQVLIQLRALRGDPVSDLIEEVHRLVDDSDDPQQFVTARVADAFAAFAGGQLQDARVAWRGVVELTSWVSESLPRAARAALWAGDPAAARDDMAALETSGIHGRAIEADRQTIRAGIAAAEGRPTEAVALYRDALRAWRDLGLAWDEALCAIDMATLLDPSEPPVIAAADSARQILTRLGARPFLERLEAALVPVSPGERPVARAVGPLETPSRAGR